VAALAAQTGCGSFAYYAQSVRGQLGLVAAARPVEEVLADPLTAPEVQRRLVMLPELHRFARERLGLPHSDSYRSYADVGGEAVVWSVVAAPVDSLEARQWCYPVIGCASYRGYFRRQDARSYAAKLAGEGWDVAVEPVPAYSTLGWFSDPLPSTVIGWPTGDIAALVFHELAHESLYVRGDSAFNEAYATVVEKEGVRRWIEEHADEEQRHRYGLQVQRRSEFLRLLRETRGRLSSLYASRAARDALLARKAEIFVQLRVAYAALKVDWNGYSGYDRWFDRPLNNAHLASIETYTAWEPALNSLLRDLGGDLEAFHLACRQIAELPAAQRRARLRKLAERPSSDTLSR
jgi:predicted aminopeptidase